MKVGQYIKINKRSVVGKNGKANLVPAKESRQRVIAVYLSGKVQTETGDVWMPTKTTRGWVGAY